MAKIRIETITPIHIGSGETLKRNNDYVVFDGGDSLGVIDERKVLSLVGEDHIDEWVSYIERGDSVATLVNKYAGNAKITDWIKRTIDNYASGSQSLKECLHDGMGRPYIPGSSIKGAIRTAVLDYLVRNDSNLDRFIEGKVSSKEVEKCYIGRDANDDFFRFIQVGDAYFNRNVEVALDMASLNITEKDDLLDKSKSQPIEAINWENETIFELRFNRCQYDLAKGKVKEVPLQIQSIEGLFLLINNHTKSLLEQDKLFWSNIDIAGAESYLEQIDEILDEITNCDNKSCILRIGHGSGWTFMTGGWAQRLRNFETKVVPKSRRNNDIYERKGYPFPKTRRIVDDEDSTGLLGFVKLTQI